VTLEPGDFQILNLNGTFHSRPALEDFEVLPRERFQPSHQVIGGAASKSAGA
jgi:hypothetical protein